MIKKQHTPEEKARLVLAAIRGDKTVNEIAAENNVNPSLLSKWKGVAEKQLYTLYQNNSAKELKVQKDRNAELDELYVMIGKLTQENEWLKKKSGL